MLDGVSGEIHPGEVILLRGENGSGKTTLLNILTGCLEPEAGTISYPPSTLSDDQPVRNKGFRQQSTSFSFPLPWHREINPFQHFTPEAVARLGVGRTWQDIRLFSSLDLADNIAAASVDSSDSPWSALFRTRHTRELAAAHRHAASARLAALGLIGRDNSSAGKISLGQSKRVAIARALQAEARILFLDEPLAGLDADGIHDVLAHLRALATDHGLTLVIIEHVLNIPRLLDFVSTVWTLQDGCLSISSPETVRQEVAESLSATDIHALIRQALGNEVPVTTQALPHGAKLTNYWVDDGVVNLAAPPVLEVRNLIIQRGPRRLWDDSTTSPGLSFTLFNGTVNVLEAPNGWGKSSLAIACAGIRPASSGGIWITFNGDTHPIRKAGDVTVITPLGAIFESLSIKETLQLSPESQTGYTAMPIQSGVISSTMVGSLSGGEMQMLTHHTIGKPNGLPRIYDEPLSHLDRDATKNAISSILSDRRSCQLILIPSNPT